MKNAVFQLIVATIGLTAWVAFIFLLVLLLGLEFLAQSNVLTSLMGYLPSAWLFGPILGLATLLCVLRPGQGIFILTSTLVLWWSLGGYAGWSTGPAPPPQKGELRLLTWNRGQSKNASLREVITAVQPDVIFLQDTKLTHYAGRPQYQDYPWIVGLGEFVMLSRLPLSNVRELRPQVRLRGASQRLWGIEAELNLEQRRVKLVNLHAPSPRGFLYSLVGGRFLWGVLGWLPIRDWPERKAALDAFWDPYHDFFHQLVANWLTHREATVIAGDFNLTPTGPIHRLLCDHWKDAHLEAGEGFGYTFPGNSRNALTFFQPWLRLDAAYLSAHWQVLRCRPIDADAQHLPLCVDLRLAPSHKPQ